MLSIRHFTCNAFGENTFLLWDESGRGAIVDPGCQSPEERLALHRCIAEENLVPSCILLTHGHFDHIYGVAECVARYGIPVYLDEAEKAVLPLMEPHCRSFGMPLPDTSFPTCPVREGDVVRFGNTSFTAISTPGHSPGGVCWYDEADRLLLSGDTLFAGTIGRTDLPLGDYDKLIVSIMDKLMGLPGEVDVLPGHGPRTDISHERTHNPFLQPFNEPWETDDPSFL